MLKIERTSQFKRDYKRELKGRYRLTLESMLITKLNYFINDIELPSHYHDHLLTGNWKSHRDCHLKPDLVLLYRHFEETHTVQLVRLGSHSELGL